MNSTITNINTSNTMEPTKTPIMPSTTSATASSTVKQTTTEEQDAITRDQDRNLPLANISRIMKRVLPNNVKVSKEAMTDIQKCVSEFISFITSEAGEKCSLEKRKTLNGDDILFALLNMGFDNYNDVLQIYLSKYRESMKETKPDKKLGDMKSNIGLGVSVDVKQNG